MKSIFTISFIVMGLLTVLVVRTLPEWRSDVPILWWTTDPNPVRMTQIDLFDQWMNAKHYPDVNVRLDSGSIDSMKIIVQSSSGVGSDLVDIYGGGQLRQYVAAGVLEDITDLAKNYGFGLDNTYKSVREEIFVNGRQYAFPCNVSSSPFIINKDLLKKEGLPIPRYDWTWDEFLEWCLKVKKTDKNGNVTRYAIWPLERIESFWLTNGGTIFNETLTKCTIDSPAVLEATEFYYDLMFKYKVMPPPLDRLAATQTGYGDIQMHWFRNEMVLAVQTGRFCLIQLRKIGNAEIDVVLVPHKLMPIQTVTCRATGINAVAKDKKLASMFLEFLADAPYNQSIVSDADGLPPNPKFAKTEEFIRPVAFPMEQGVHEKFYRATEEFGVGSEYSKFVSPTTVQRIIDYYRGAIDSGDLTVKESLKRMTDDINLEIERSVDRDTKLQSEYKKAVGIQDQIDAYKHAGNHIPIKMIENVVIRYFMEAGKWQQ